MVAERGVVGWLVVSWCRGWMVSIVGDAVFLLLCDDEDDGGTTGNKSDSKEGVVVLVMRVGVGEEAVKRTKAGLATFTECCQVSITASGDVPDGTSRLKSRV